MGPGGPNLMGAPKFYDTGGYGPVSIYHNVYLMHSWAHSTFLHWGVETRLCIAIQVEV